MAVKIIPARIPINGLLKLDTRSTKAAESRSGIMEELIISIPIKRIPRPAIICP